MVKRLATPGIAAAGRHPSHNVVRRPGHDLVRRPRAPAAVAVVVVGGALVMLMGPLRSAVVPDAQAPDDGRLQAGPVLTRPVSEAPLVETPPESASTAGEFTPAADRIRVLALEQDRHGRWLARLQVGEADARLVQAGEALARGVRVERIARDGVSVRRGLRLDFLRHDGPVRERPSERPQPTALPPPAASVIVSPPGREAPSRDAVERAVERAVARSLERAVARSLERAALPTIDRAPDLARAPPAAPR